MNTQLPQVEAQYKVGDDISIGFNGDWYPRGKVTRFTKSRKFMYNDFGEKFVQEWVKQRQKRPDGEYGDVMQECYKSVGGTWAVVKGIIDERNPHV